MVNLDLLNSRLIHQKVNHNMNDTQSTYYHLSFVNTNLLTVPLQSMNSFTTIAITNRFNVQYNNFVTDLGLKVQQRQQELMQKLAINPQYNGDRFYARNLAWEYEKADIVMGGSGSNNWNKYQRQEILEKGSVRGYEAHHPRNVADHPKDQADPNNVKFYTREEHKKAHGGKWANPTDDPKIDREAMLKRTNRKRVVRNEIKGAGIAAIIGFATGATIGFIVTIAQNGISPDSLKDAAINGGKVGIEGAALGLINHVGTRLVGDIATNAMTGLLSNFGIEITKNIAIACNIGVVGSIAIITFSVYQFIRLKMNGVSTKDALRTVGKNAGISVASLAVTVIVQAAFGGPAALAVSIGIPAVMLSYTMYNYYHDKKLMNRIHCYAIEKSYPLIIK